MLLSNPLRAARVIRHQILTLEILRNEECFAHEAWEDAAHRRDPEAEEIRQHLLAARRKRRTYQRLIRRARALDRELA